MLQHFIECMLHCLQLLFFFYKHNFILHQRCFITCDLRFKLYPFISFSIVLCI